MTMILHMENPKDYAKNLLKLINKFSKVGGYMTNIQKSVAFLYMKMRYQKGKSKGKLRILFFLINLS